MKKDSILAIVVALFLSATPVGAQLWNEEPAMEVHVTMGTGNSSAEGLDGSGSKTIGAGMELYLLPKISLGFGAFRISGDISGGQLSHVSFSRTVAEQNFNFYAASGRLRPYAMLGQGYVTNNFSFGFDGQNFKTSSDNYAFSVGGGLKARIAKGLELGPQIRLTFGGMKTFSAGATISYVWRN